MLRQKHGIREGSRLASMLIYLATGLCCIVTVYPMYYVLIRSVSAPEHALAGDMLLFPKGFDLNSYRVILSDTTLWRAYGNTLLYVVVTTLLMLLFCTLCAYPLCMPGFWAKRPLSPTCSFPCIFRAADPHVPCNEPPWPVQQHLGRHPAWVSEHLEHHSCTHVFRLYPGHHPGIRSHRRRQSLHHSAAHLYAAGKAHPGRHFHLHHRHHLEQLVQRAGLSADTALQPLQLYLRRVLLETPWI